MVRALCLWVGLLTVGLLLRTTAAALRAARRERRQREADQRYWLRRVEQFKRERGF